MADHEQIAGAGTDTLPNATAFFVPLIGSQQCIGAIGVKANEPDRFANPDQRRLLETCASLIALSLERDQSVLEAGEARLRVQAEELRNALLSSVSHDLRTPLAAIAGASSALLDESADQQPSVRAELLQSIVDESHRLARQVDNLLEMTRLEAGTRHLNRQWHVLDEILGSAVSRLTRALERHALHVHVPEDLPLLFVDALLLEQAFVNLLENAARYCPAGTRIDVTARRAADGVEVRFADNGPGLPPGSESRVFDKFYRGARDTPDGRRGVGLGLAICAGIIRAHDGTIVARNREPAGAEFTLYLPRGKETPPTLIEEDVARPLEIP